ncbi:MAG: DUF5615 family PIN-like protein [Armatimonadetes bacterium]|nr:DUF5615 family PIN-like protein [Armatimonadota bacterium]
MNFLADESCDFEVVRILRVAGHDVTSIAEVSPRLPDRSVIELAVRRKMILLTEDKDFGQLVYAGASPSGTVILLRFPANARAALPAAVTDLITQKGSELSGCFAVVQPGRVRITRMPGSSGRD